MKTVQIERNEHTFFVPVRDFLAAYQTTSTEHRRYYLNGVFFDRGVADNSESAILVATDGHAMLTVDLTGRAGVWFGDEFTVKTDIKDKAFKAKAQGYLSAWAYGDTRTGLIQIVQWDVEALDHAERIGVVEFETVDGSFPDWRRVKPVFDEPHAPACLDGSLVARFTTVAQMFGRSACLRIEAFGNGRGPMRVGFPTAPHVSGILMPMDENVARRQANAA